MKKIIILFCFVIILTLASCVSADTDALWSQALYTEDTELGEGEKTLSVKVEAGEKSIVFTLHTDAETLGEALLDNSLIEGEDSQYGIYIKKANGILADYKRGGYYWELTRNGEYLMTGADMTEISDGEQYEFTRTK